jgi:hypothetical protein
MPARMAASLIGLGLLLAGPQARAQTQTSAAPSSPYALIPRSDTEAPQVLHFVKPPTPLPAPAAVMKPMAPELQPKFTDKAVRPVGYQENKKDSGRTPPPGEGEGEYSIQLEPPGPQQVFRLEAESSLQERMRQEGRQRPTPERIQFPDEPVVGAGTYKGRDFKPMTMTVEPNYLCYHRLYFERVNTERYGWDLGFIQPVVSVGQFYWDLAWLPYHMWTEPCRNYDSNAGYCLPGDPVPYLLYPPQFSLTGVMAEAGVVVGLAFVF